MISDKIKSADQTSLYASLGIERMPLSHEEYIKALYKFTCSHYGFAGLKNEGRTRGLVKARYSMMYVLRHECGFKMTLKEIGKELGRPDHSLVNYGIEDFGVALDMCKIAGDSVTYKWASDYMRAFSKFHFQHSN
jgi:putative component of membrane protein insertase Oxa1/YidC/SpoIIIJ protein YidD